MSLAAWVWFVITGIVGTLVVQQVAHKSLSERFRVTGTLKLVAKSLIARSCAAVIALLALACAPALAQSAPEAAGGEANLKLPDLSQVNFLGMDGHTLL